MRSIGTFSLVPGNALNQTYCLLMTAQKAVISVSARWLHFAPCMLLDKTIALLREVLSLFTYSGKYTVAVHYAERLLFTSLGSYLN